MAEVDKGCDLTRMIFENLPKRCELRPPCKMGTDMGRSGEEDNSRMNSKYKDPKRDKVQWVQGTERRLKRLECQ